ncbi:hypothetical protein [Terrabacter sp. NPDC000476]|uniref:hypothetical protein n=1 Tax=Terrabacter sp. NPDC000476 TaxID=3154258 RepID=UPI00331B4F65
MSAGTVSLTPQEALARELIVERSAARHHAPKQGRTRRHVRAALLLRGLAERLDPVAERPRHADRPAPHRAQSRPDLHVVTAVHAGNPRPWTAVPRRSPHRHT